jgi:hypothetical protein
MEVLMEAALLATEVVVKRLSTHHITMVNVAWPEFKIS